MHFVVVLLISFPSFPQHIFCGLLLFKFNTGAFNELSKMEIKGEFGKVREFLEIYMENKI